MTRLTVLASLEEAARDGLTAIQNALSDLAVIDWVLIAIALFLVYWAFALLWAVANLGPVEVELIEYDGEEAANPAKSLTAGFRERLADSGLAPPPTVPAGTPQTDLIAAVEASPIPQGAFIGKLLDLLNRLTPHPPSYRLSTTLVPPEPVDEPPTTYRVDANLLATEKAPGDPLGAARGLTGVLTATAGEEDPQVSPDGATDSAPMSRVSFWLKPSREGRPLLRTVSGKDYKAALDRAAAWVFMHISRDAVLVFPTWSRWQQVRALESYLDGIKALQRKDQKRAKEKFAKASRLEPRNMLPRLQLAALLEQKGSARRLADALAQYLEIATEWPSLVEARYRASVVAATLASMTGELTPATRDSLKKLLGIDGGSKPLKEALSKRAKTESRSVLKLLQPYYTLLREGRLRSHYEPQGADRRDLKRAVAISRHCLGLRSIGVKRGFRVTVGIWRRRALVRCWHMAVGRPSIGWQAHYNAACFYALLKERQEQLPGGGGNG